jgi:hypothetical protein
MMLREMHRPKREIVVGDVKNCITRREKRNTHRVSLGKPEG